LTVENKSRRAPHVAEHRLHCRVCRTIRYGTLVDFCYRCAGRSRNRRRTLLPNFSPVDTALSCVRQTLARWKVPLSLRPTGKWRRIRRRGTRQSWAFSTLGLKNEKIVSGI